MELRKANFPLLTSEGQRWAGREAWAWVALRACADRTVWYLEEGYMMRRVLG